MKKLMLAIFASFIYVGAFAQTDSSEKKLMPPDYENDSLNNPGNRSQSPTQRGDSLQNNNRNSAHPDHHQDGSRNMNKTNSGSTGTNQRSATPADNTRTDDSRTSNPNTTNNANNTNNPVKVSPNQDGVLIMNGKTVVVKGGQTTTMTQPVNLTNGARIMPDGTLIDKDGTSVKLREGDYLDFSGQYLHRNPSNATGTGAGYDKDKNQTIDRDKKMNEGKSKDKNMYLVPDSTLKNKKVD